MKKLTLKIFTFLFATLVILLLVILLKDIPSSTAAYSGVIALDKDVEFHFKPNFDYGLNLSMEFLDSASSNSSDSITIFLQNMSDFASQIKKIPIKQASITEIYIGHLTSDEYKMKLLDVTGDLNNRLCNFHVDVNGGGPSVSLVWDRKLRPYFWIFLFVSLLGLCISAFLMIKKSGHCR